MIIKPMLEPRESTNVLTLSMSNGWSGVSHGRRDIAATTTAPGDTHDTATKRVTPVSSSPEMISSSPITNAVP